MGLVDDIRRDIHARDYDAAIDAFRHEFQESDISLCRYGGRRPPTSDIDLVVLVDHGSGGERCRSLRRRLDEVREQVPKGTYLFDRSIPVCSRELFRTVQWVHPAIPRSEWEVLSGVPIALDDPTPTDFVRDVLRLNHLLLDWSELDLLAASDEASLRAMLSALGKVARDFDASYGDGPAEHGFPVPDVPIHLVSTLQDGIAELRAEVLRADGFRKSDQVKYCVALARGMLASAVERTSSAFLRSALSCPESDWEGLITHSAGAAESGVLRGIARRLNFLRNRPATTNRYDEAHQGPLPSRNPEMPPAALLHTAAYSVVGAGPAPFRVQLNMSGPGLKLHHLVPAYRELLFDQMTKISQFHDWARQRGVASFPVSAAGHWHEWVPPVERRWLRKALIGAFHRH